MNMIGYLVTLMNIQSFRDQQGPINDVKIKVGEVADIAAALMQEGIFHLSDFRDTGYQRRGNTGRYVSEKVRDFLYNRNVSATETGVAVTLIFSDEGAPTRGLMLQSPARPTLQPQQLPEKYLHREIRITDVRDARALSEHEITQSLK